jgi:hypothetical protein
MKMAEKAKYEMYLDEKLQVIREKVDGQIEEEDAKNIETMSEKLVTQLKDPRKVKVFISVSNLSRMSSKVRKIFINGLKRNNLYKVAITGSSPYLKAVITFFFIAAGINKVKLFNNEREAIRWFNE